MQFVIIPEMKWILGLIAVALSLIPNQLQGQFDTLWLRNGQMLYGEFNSLDVGILKFDAEAIGVVELKHFEVSTFTAALNFFKIRRLNEDEMTGWILPSDTGFVRVADLLDTVSVPLHRIVTLDGFEEDFNERWSGLIGAGYSYTRSSRISRYNTDASFHYKGEDLNLDMSSSFILTGQGDSLARDREEASAVLNRFIAHNWSVFGGGSYQRNLTLGLRYRYQGALGMTYIDYLTNQLKLSVGSGFVINTEQNFESDELESLEVPIFFDFTFFKYRSPKISLVISQYVYLGVTTMGRVRHDGEIRLSWEIIDDFSLTLNFYNNFDNQSPSTGEALLDYGIVTGISYSL